jgi:hypothetical protein
MNDALQREQGSILHVFHGAAERYWESKFSKYITQLLAMHLPKIEEIIASSYRSKDNKCTVQEKIN